MQPDRFLLEDKLWVVSHPIGVPAYDFSFRDFFRCRTPYATETPLPAVARIGAFDDYTEFHRAAEQDGLRLLNSPEEQRRCSSLPEWYPLIEQSTPRSRWFREIPAYEQLLGEFTPPLFLKGARQTSRHRASNSIIRNRDDYDRATTVFRHDSVLQWQEFVCREFVPLRRVPGDTGERVPPSYEFRTFWTRDTLLGAGRYWYDVPDYRWTESERDAALAVAAGAARALDCGFCVIDLAMTADGRWLVIECNDGMESGYAGISPFLIWQQLLETLSV